MKGTLHITARTSNGQEVFTSAHYRGPSLDGILARFRRVHPVSTLGWTTAAGTPVDPHDVNLETLTLLTFVEESETP